MSTCQLPTQLLGALFQFIETGECFFWAAAFVRHVPNSAIGGTSAACAALEQVSVAAVTHQPQLIGLDRLPRQEREACLIAVQALKPAAAEAWDIDSRQGAVDAMLTLHDGRKAAFEVTNLAGEGALEVAGRLARDNHSWPLPGDWFWSIQVDSPQALTRLKATYQKIILILEAAGEPYPDRGQTAWSPSADADLRWLVEDSGSNMIGHPDIAAKNRGAMVTAVARFGFVDESLSGFGDELSEAFRTPHIPEHFEKLEKAAADERDLFIPLHDSTLTSGISSELTFGETLPSEPPPVPDYITRLWLAPAYSRRVLLWRENDGWCNFVPTRSNDGSVSYP